MGAHHRSSWRGRLAADGELYSGSKQTGSQPAYLNHRYVDRKPRYVFYGRTQPVGEKGDGCDNVRLKKSSNYTYYYSDQNTKNNHGSNWEIKTEVFLFNPYIARQMADPVQFIVKKVYNKAYDHNGASDEHNIFAGIGIHINFILITAHKFHT